jgi:putative hydrolase of the HAD superfamily
MTKWLLCDYGEVLAMAPSSVHRSALETEAGAGPEFWATYWEHRPAYDRSDLDTIHYWTKVLGYAPEFVHLRRLIGLDIVMWSQPNHPSLAAIGRAAERGVKLALLSNAPAELADRFDKLPWLAALNPRLFSGHLGIIKPEPAIYAIALDALRAEPQEVTFIDDRQENIEAAKRAGLQAELFIHPDQIDCVNQGADRSAAKTTGCGRSDDFVR